MEHFVTKNHLMKAFFLKIADQASATAGLSSEHAEYTLLIRAMDYVLKRNCTGETVLASSTLSPDFGIENTINFHGIGRVWSSKGRNVPDGTETLMYKLSESCLVERITIDPVQGTSLSTASLPIKMIITSGLRVGALVLAAFTFLFLYPHILFPFVDNSLPGSPIFQAHRVRFLLGDYDDANGFKETFTTDYYPMNSDTQQRFYLHKPTLCIAKHMVMEFSGFVEKEPSDGLYYMRVSMVQVRGRSLAGTFRTRDSVPAGNLVVEAITYMDPKIKTDHDKLEGCLEVTSSSMIPLLVQFVEENGVLSSDDSD